MKGTPETARRWSGLIFLTLAILMLVLGMTVLDGMLSPWAFVLYWTICFLLTGLAALSGVLEMLIIRWRSREEQKELIRSTLEEVREKQEKAESGQQEWEQGPEGEQQAGEGEWDKP